MMHFGLSVAMCVFNGQRFLAEQLKSIANQERPPDEVVVCDDGSTDGSIEIVKEFARRSAFPTRLFINPENLRSTRNFEKAISLCHREVVAMADQDDVWYRHKLSRIEKAFTRSAETIAVFSDADLIDAESRLLNLRLWKTLAFDVAEQSQFAAGREFDILVKHPVITGAAMAFRRSYFDSLAPFPPDRVHDWWISMLLAATGTIEMIPEPLMMYRRHGTQQLGPGPVNLGERVAHVRRRGADFYRDEIMAYRQVYDRLGERRDEFLHADRARKKLEGKIRHLRHRAGLPPAKGARLMKISREAINGNYWRFSGGWKSVAKDLILR